MPASAARAYSWSKHRPGGGVKQDEARKVVNKRTERNIAPPGMALALAYSPPSAAEKRVGEALLRGPGKAWLGKQVGKGLYGRAYLTKLTPTSRPRLVRLVRSMAFVTSGSLPALGDSVVIKVNRFNKAEDSRKAWLKAALRESAVHWHLTGQGRQACARVPGCAKQPCVADHAPRFYVSGVVGDTYVTVMGVAPGQPLERLLARTPPGAELYLQVERAACALWASGFVHADMHKDNVFYDPSTRTATLIDFGYAVMLPDELRRSIVSRMAPAIGAGVRSLGEVFRSSARSKHGINNLQGYVNRVQHVRGFDWYNPDYTALTRLYSRLSPKDKLRVPEMRRALWTCGNTSNTFNTSNRSSRGGRGSRNTNSETPGPPPPPGSSGSSVAAPRPYRVARGTPRWRWSILSLLFGSPRRRRVMRV